MTIEERKKEFIHREFCTLCFLASFGMALRFPFYRKDADRDSIKAFCRDELSNLAIQYSRTVSETEHIQNIEAFQNSVNDRFSVQLARDGLTFGRAQKLINLYLKYMWVSGYIEEPPHCPIDSIVIGALGRGVADLRFTAMTKDQYKKVLLEINQRRGDQSIAEWELDVFNQR